MKSYLSGEDYAPIVKGVLAKNMKMLIKTTMLNELVNLVAMSTLTGTVSFTISLQSWVFPIGAKYCQTADSG